MRPAWAGARASRPGGPVRNLVGGVLFVLAVMAAAIAGYVNCGWSFGDALYMAVLTVFTVGYEEVHPVAGPELRTITIGLIVLGCSGTIFLTGALVQAITFSQLNDILGTRRMKSQIDLLRDHVIICGFGRIGQMLARDLAAGGVGLVVLDRSGERLAAAQAGGMLVMEADATDEETLVRAGIARARALATVLPDDSANVFITLSARSLNEKLTIIARGEAPNTERKLLQAGADRVVLPAHIGAERIAEIILYPALSDALRHPTDPADPSAGAGDLRRLGLELHVVVVEPNSPFAGRRIAEIERRAEHGFLILSLQDGPHGEQKRAEPGMRVPPGAGLTLVARTGRAVALDGFRALIRTGRAR
jgi:voltage-gated potassium channel